MATANDNFGENSVYLPEFWQSIWDW